MNSSFILSHWTSWHFEICKGYFFLFYHTLPQAGRVQISMLFHAFGIFNKVDQIPLSSHSTLAESKKCSSKQAVIWEQNTTIHNHFDGHFRQSIEFHFFPRRHKVLSASSKVSFTDTSLYSRVQVSSWMVLK